MLSHKSRIILVLVLFFLSSISIAGVAMTFFSSKDEHVVLFSPMDGVITYNGNIVKNAEVIRKATWGDKFEFSEKCLTNDRGEFSFPLKVEKWKQSRLTQFIVHQDIVVNYDNDTYTIWHMGKMDRGEYGELGGKPVNFRCELTDEIEYVEGVIGLLGTSCKWDSIIKEH